MRKSTTGLVTAVGLGMLALTFTTGMSAAGAKTISAGTPAARPTGGKALPGSAGIANALPKGYTIATSAPITALNGQQTHGVAVCPAGTKPVGGGAYVQSDSLSAGLNSSYPLGNRDWAADVNNASGASTGMQVYAVCIVRGAANFTVTSQVFAGGADAQTTGAVSCPTGVVVGGGVLSASGSTAVNVNSLFPNSTQSWRADMDNATSLNENFTVYAICRVKKPGGYSLQIGSSTLNPAGAQTGTSAVCPGASVALSGGALSTSGSTSVSLNESVPANQQQWGIYENNGSALGANVTAYVICAGK